MRYLPEKYHNIQIKEYREIIEGLKHKQFKWTYDTDYDGGQLEKLLMQGHIGVPRENLVRIPNEVYIKRRSGKTGSRATGTKMK